MKKFLFSLVGLLAFSGAIFAQIEWSEDHDGRLNLSDLVEIHEDASHELTIETILADSGDIAFERKGDPILNFGFTESHYWIKFELENNSEEPLILEFAGPHLEYVDLYEVVDGELVESYHSGYSFPLNEKLLKHHFQLFELNRPNATYYIHMSAPVQPVPLRLYEEANYEVKTYRQRLVFGFYIGFMVFAILSNLFFFYSLRNPLFLFYAGVVVLYLSYSAFVMDGFIVYFLDGLDIQFWYVQIPTFGVIVQLVYAMVFLEIHKYSRRIYKISAAIAIYFITYFFLKFFLPITVVYGVNTLNAFISFFTMFLIGYTAGKKGNKLGYYFAAAYFVYFALVIIEGVYIQTGSPGYFAELSHVTWATLIEAFMLSFLLSKRFEWEKIEAEEAKMMAQKEALEKTLENEKIIREQNIILEAKVSERTDELSKSLEDLKATQTKLIQSEKLASLGELTAGIAHEIKNPLNFVNNFAELGNELIQEIDEFMKKEDYAEVAHILSDLKTNLDKINEHGKRADSIVKSMLLHSRAGGSQKEQTNINKLCEEYTKLAFHGFRAKDKSFTAQFELKLDENLPEDTYVSQDFGRVLLNLVTNAFYAVNKKFSSMEASERSKYSPTVTIETQRADVDGEDTIRIRIADNGTGIPQSVKEKIFQPFFTTKPAGEGTGLGLSLVFDIIKSFKGNIHVDSEEGEGTTFELEIPITSFK